MVKIFLRLKENYRWSNGNNKKFIDNCNDLKLLNDIDWWNTDKERRNIKRVSKSEHKNCRVNQWKNKGENV